MLNSKRDHLIKLKKFKKNCGRVKKRVNDISKLPTNLIISEDEIKDDKRLEALREFSQLYKIIQQNVELEIYGRITADDSGWKILFIIFKTGLLDILDTKKGYQLYIMTDELNQIPIAACDTGAIEQLSIALGGTYANNEPIIRVLAKFINKIILSITNLRHIDGMILTKFDTVVIKVWRNDIKSPPINICKYIEQFYQ
ncbi:unnamed protein product [Rhizophagus irregularis]|nr:unnamed protein product [Rhizophagus irregularis]